jgi:hypothetical protein
MYLVHTCMSILSADRSTVVALSNQLRRTNLLSHHHSSSNAYFPRLSRLNFEVRRGDKCVLWLIVHWEPLW